MRGPGPLANAWRFRLMETSVHDNAYNFNSQPQGVELVTTALTQVVILVAAAQVVETNPQPFLVFSQRDFQRLSGRRAFLQVGSLGLDEESEGVAWFRR